MITAPVDVGRVHALVHVVARGKDGEIRGKLNIFPSDQSESQSRKWQRGESEDRPLTKHAFLGLREEVILLELDVNLQLAFTS